MRTADTTRAKRPKTWPSVEGLRLAADVAVKAKGFKNRTDALRKCDLSTTTFERLLREGLSENGRVSVERKLAAMGVLHIVPRR